MLDSQIFFPTQIAAEEYTERLKKIISLEREKLVIFIIIRILIIISDLK